MAYEVEDEVEWSDGTLDEPPSTSTNASGDSGYVSPAAHEDDGLDYLFESQGEDEHDVPIGTALSPAPDHPTLSRAQRARIGVRPNRRQPSEQDYAHFALYQANQKAYEATFLKHFVKHALHPSQLEQCLQNGADACSNMQKYIASVSANIAGVANKMTWNAHCRAVNLRANAGKDGAPFWDVGTLDRTIFADFEPSNATLVVHKMCESWHRIAPEPPMVRYTTKDYAIGYHSSPLEEIDEVAHTLFRREAFGSSIPTSHAVQYPTKRRSKGRGLPGASARDLATSTRRDNWLSTLMPQANVQEHHESSPDTASAVSADTPCNISAAAEPEILNDLRQFRDDGIIRSNTTVEHLLTEASQPHNDLPSAGLTQLEQLFEQFGADALSDHRQSNVSPSQQQVDHSPTWLTRLLNDHKRRLTQRSPQVFRRPLPGIRAVIAEAISRVYHPVNPDFEELVGDIESWEQSAAAFVAMPEEGTDVAQINEEVDTNKLGSTHDKKRKGEQPAPIRMFNKPIEQPRRSVRSMRAY